MNSLFKWILIGLLSLGLTSANLKQTGVYICVSAGAYAYHKDTKCSGMKKCTHTIKEVTIKYATDTLRRKPCGYCYPHS